jgi:tRNA 2-thiouridine synthesizing protein A
MDAESRGPEFADEPSVEQLHAKVERFRGSPCGVCGRAVCGHELLMDVAMGLSHAQCLACLARAMDSTTTQLRDQLFAHFRRRACYGNVWQHQSEREGFGGQELPECLWRAGESVAFAAETITAGASSRAQETIAAADVWDAGEMSCGDLVLALRLRMQRMLPAAVLRLIAQDPGAREDIPAWCRMTGHVLLRQDHPEYWIRRKE